MARCRATAVSPYRFTFAHGIVADDRQAARVTHMANCLNMPGDEWDALDGQRAEFLGGRKFQVGRAVVEVQHGYAAPYGTSIKWEPLRRTA
jgi:hypothetical protein